MNGLELTLLYLLAGVLSVAVCRWLKWPAVLGYLSAGVLIGPHGLAWVPASEGVSHLGELGVVFLMFIIGLEFNLRKLKALQRHVFGLGALQVSLTLFLVTAGFWLVSLWLHDGLPHPWSLSWQSALALGAALAMSSTAIVTKMMGEALELESAHGKRVMGVLLFQDLAVVPLLVLIPALSSPAPMLMNELGLALLKGVLLVALLLVGGQKIMRWWLTLVARRQSSELFMLNLLLITLGLAWLTEKAGLSLALGAFLGGVLVSETDFKWQVEADIKPFHDVLLGLFFITVGMVLNPRVVFQHWAAVLLLLLLPSLLKLSVVVGLSRFLGASAGVALRTGIYLSQSGEFGFVLLSLSAQQGLLPDAWLQPLLAAMVLSMFITPFLIQNSQGWVMRFVASEWLEQSLQMTQIARQTLNADHHVIICGYGRSGQNLARLLEQEGIAYVALDMDPDRVRQAAANGDHVVFGDAARLPALMAAGLNRASAVVITYLNVPGALKVLANTRQHAPQVPVVVRTQDDHALEQLRAAGATEVVPEAIEGSLMLASHALALVGVPMRRVLRVVQAQRDARYNLLRGYFHGADDDTALERDQDRLLPIKLAADAFACGRALGPLNLSQFRVRPILLRRSNGKITPCADEVVLAVNDTLTLLGRPHDLSAAQDYLSEGTL
jgi:CPA2 family monovalent cation:H+ antiporter-2